MVRIETLSSAHDRSLFDCGVADLTGWLQRQAGQSDRRNVTLTRVALEDDSNRVVGYYATKTYHLEGPELALALGPDAGKYPVPCVLLARLAVCESAQGQGVGALLLAHALRACTRVSEETGLQFVVVHAIDETAATFYERFGFERFVDHEHRLLMPMKTVKASV